MNCTDNGSPHHAAIRKFFPAFRAPREVATPPTQKRTGEVRFHMGKVRGRLNLVARGDGTVGITHKSQIDEIVNQTTLVALAEAGNQNIREIDLWLERKGAYAVMDRKDLRKFLLEAGILNEG